MAISLLIVAATLVLPSLTNRIMRFTPIVSPQKESPLNWIEAKEIFQRKEKEAGDKKGKPVKWSWPNFPETSEVWTMAAELSAMAHVLGIKEEPYGVFLDQTFTMKSVSKLVNYNPKAKNKKFAIEKKNGEIPLFINYGKNKWHFMFVGKNDNIAALIKKEIVKIFVMRQTVIDSGGFKSGMKSLWSGTKKSGKKKIESGKKKIKSGMKSLWSGTKSTIKSGKKKIESGGKKIVSGGKSLWSGIKAKASKARLQQYNDYYYGDYGYDEYNEYNGYDEYDEYDNDEYDEYNEYNEYNGYDEYDEYDNDEYDEYELYRLYRLLQRYNN